MATSLIDQKDKNYPSLNGLRVVAVWLVFVHHFPPFEAGSVVFTVAKQGYVGVSFFFVLSGFLIAHRYYEPAEFNWPFFKNYLYKRWARLYPVYFLIVTASFIVLWLAGFGFSVKDYCLNISFLKGFSDQYKFTGLSQTWSLTVEVCFYLLAPLLFVLHKRLGLFWRSLAVCYLVGFGLWYIGFGFETAHFTFFYTFFGRAFDFFVGFGVWLIARNPTVNSFFGRTLFISTIFIFGCIILLALEDHYQFDETHFNFNYTELIINNLVLPAAIGLLIYNLLHTSFNSLKKNYRANQWLAMQLLGKSSYIFFLIHLGPLSKLMTWTGWLGYFTVVNLLSVLIYWFIERLIYEKFIKILK
jgi:peptidoglycan/LPS O-acetylase OafA/YrhL